MPWKPVPMQINGVEWTADNVLKMAWTDGKIRSCIRRGYRDAQAGVSEIDGPRYVDDWRLLAWHVGWRLGDEDRRKRIN